MDGGRELVCWVDDGNVILDEVTYYKLRDGPGLLVTVPGTNSVVIYLVLFV